ncbi:Auxilin-like protein [Actinidia chinensis var. chinensis]|uniref:Auxilin-like protein n=1 Tax=Actinidia chinensis var. chinensis TaxID=1590841 RepID=A0A2R6RLH0_ACTCC|nr:Auxilin-like protein [Actinidia chinensis var. chinensis]
MENLSHSVSKRAYNGNGFGDKTLYDDVFGGPPKFGVPTLSPRVEDYAEIFGGFHSSPASSIPILDIPALAEADFSFDVRNSHFDYSQVFGGFNALDFAVSFDELLNQSKNRYDSSDEAWTPAQSESLSDESDPSAFSERSQSLSNGGSYQSCDAANQFSISYNKACQTSKENMSTGMACVTQLHSVPGLTFVVNETPPSQKIQDRNTPLLATDVLHPNVDLSGELREGKQFRKTMSYPANRNFGTQTLGTDPKPVRYGRTASLTNKSFVSVSDISLRTQPSQLPPPLRLPPVLAAREINSDRQISKLTASKSFSMGGMAGDCSPPFFDVEVDARSSAAVSTAAMRDAMEKAPAKLRSAKELIESKEGLQSHTKFGLKYDAKDKKLKASKSIDGSNCLKDERAHGSCQRDCSPEETYAWEERQTVMKTTQLVSNSIEGEKHINVGKPSADKMHGKDRSSQESYKTEGPVAWRQEAQYYEVVETDKSRKIFEQAKDERLLVQKNSQFHGSGQERKATSAFQQQDGDRRKIKAGWEVHEWDVNKGSSKATKESSRQEKHEKKVKVNQEACNQEEIGRKPRMVQNGNIENIRNEGDNPTEVQRKQNEVEIEKKLKEVAEGIEDGKPHRIGHERKDNGRRLEETGERERYDYRLKVAAKQEELEKRLKESLDLEKEEKQQREACEREVKGKRQKEARESEENEMRLKEAFEQEENKKRLKEALDREENEKRLKMVIERKENEKRQNLACERNEIEKRLVKDLRREENEKRLSGAFQLEVNGRDQKEANEWEESEERPKEAREREENEKRLDEAWEQIENTNKLQEAHEREESQKRSNEAFKPKENAKKTEEANEGQETQKGIEVAGHCEVLKGCSTEHEQKERKPKSDQRTHVQPEGERFIASDEECTLDDYEDLQSGQAACKQDIKNIKVKKNQRALSFEEDRTTRAESIDINGQVEAVEVVNASLEEQPKSSGVALVDQQHDKNQIGKNDDTKSPYQQDNVTGSVEADNGTGPHVNRHKTASETASNLGKSHALTHELGRRVINVKEVENEETKDKLMSSHVGRELMESGRKIGSDQTTVLVEKRNAQSTAQKDRTRQNIERKEKNILAPEEREKEDGIKRERELEKDRLKRIEEDRERKREREKDRMAVDRATLEARERAFAETRERAERASVERATAEVRQRVMAEARDRLEKASTEARERSLSEKASMEARLRAERAAVERATAEARERAFQKAMAEKAHFEAREHIERSVADKSSGACKGGGLRQSSSLSDLQDVQCPGVGASSGPIYSYSSVHGGVEGESAQRCKARLERHQRTAERAAKALAEKNMRDLLAQREQAERNRLAEALDAEVKRWSSGKEGNLRALLSTLQYILGPDSGWQPIPLTEVITSAAVKKAYRKANLCVHPDKLQQRGASIQQKYICEKVFDLLKEAWNKFNSEER